MVCPNCGAENQENAFCCYNCGGELSTYSYSEPAKVEAPKKNAFAIVSLICGIVSIVSCGMSGIPTILAIVFGIIARSKDKTNNLALIGIILGAVSLVIGIIAGVIIGVAYGSMLSSMMYY